MNSLKSINPYTGKLIAEREQLSQAELRIKIEHAAESFLRYRESSFEYRRDRMQAVSSLLLEGKEQLAELISSEMGKLKREAIAEVEKCAWVCEYYAEHAASFLQGRKIESDATQSGVLYQPLGTILAVMPWNFPFWQVFRFAAPALMAGNTALLKHASNVQGCAAAIESIFLEAGFESGVFINLPIAASRVEEVILHPAVKAASLTGSESAGKAVAAACAKVLKKCVLELGGSNPFVVLNDADLDLTLEQAITGRLLNAGQSCIAAKRFLVEAKVYSEFLLMLTEKVRKLNMGDPLLEQTDIAPLFSEVQADEIDRQVKDAMEKGARLETGGRKDGCFYEPTILTGAKPGMEIFDQETFGPVYAITSVSSREEALELANRSRFGLGLQVFTQSEEAADYFIENADEGAVFVNGFVKSDPRLPFGGVKNSGYGRELSREGILEFVNCKTYWRR